ncbi:hypothetical protein [Microbacterium oleivorans]|uniref:hypothetical protein n=1 Tax=Microbacterium oleivorans TaxID=273677 RepID=UPI00080E71DC|nr:hypothetical protein [Microbacterium oleivorans]
MTDAVWINFSTLERTSTQLRNIIGELEDAGGLADELAGAIGRPYGKGALADKVGDFESRWDDRRKDLVRDVTKIQEHVQGVLDGFSDWDSETASQMDIDASGNTDATRPTAV